MNTKNLFKHLPVLPASIPLSHCNSIVEKINPLTDLINSEEPSDPMQFWQPIPLKRWANLKALNTLNNQYGECMFHKPFPVDLVAMIPDYRIPKGASLMII